ncbi:MAG: HAD hydrolase-like protein [Bacteroidota bacterium]|nr:HAD hydrolase-like protein [uncultured Allomuricauda sp.]
MKTKKVLLFDIDGVINKAHYFSKPYEQEFGVPRSEIRPFFQTDFIPCLTGKVDLKAILPPYLKKWKWKEDVNAFLHYWFAHDVKLDHELIGFVQTLRAKGYFCALASQQEQYRKNHLWETKGLKNKFDHFYCSSDIGFLKKDTRFFDAVVHDLKAKSLIKLVDEVVFWDDTRTCIATALESGMEAILFKENEDIINYNF